MVKSFKSALTAGGARSAYALLLPYIRKRFKAYLGLLLLVPLDIGLTLAFAWFLGEMTDAAVRQQFSRLGELVVIGAGLSLLTIGSGLLRNRLEFTAINGVKQELSERLLQHLLLLPASRTDRLHTGELTSHFQQDLHNLDGLIGSNLVQWIRLPLVFGAVLVYMIHIHWVMAVIGLAIVPLTLGAGAILGLLLRRKAREIHDRYGYMNRLLTETLQGISVIRSFLAERLRVRKYTDVYGELYGLHRKYTLLQGWIRAGGEAAGAAIFMISLCLGAYFVSEQVISVGALLAFVNLSGHLLYPLTGMAGLWLGIQESSAAADRIGAMLNEPAESEELPERLPAPRWQSIEFREVGFSYDGRQPVIDGLNLTVAAGQTVAIVGGSGAGKSTLFSLLQGFYKPESGSILLDGVSADTLSASKLRSAFALVSQETFLFSGTIRDNLLLARPDAEQHELESAARYAQIHDFILTLPNRYETEIGERGIALSGGQRQRIAIARAILRDAPILLLDEGTAALDSETEFQVQRSLERLMANRTTIVIAHRLSTIRSADRIVVLDRGTIAQSGTHDELIAGPGLYRSMYVRQQLQEGGESYGLEAASCPL
ncbi:ABC transporter ATP-binding protein [Paenibacillus humicola]|uniref:ABC transporter ATP-binding protein n=1 Tax=Paenibacillus humicola TaxID=3110540 RepID=UPI00237A1E18|nr:ABC transporter ATP-binding protein [Paenibacillus humicola]